MFKDLKLNRDNIEQVIIIYAENNYKSYSLNKIEKNPMLTRYELKLDDKNLFIDFYFNSKGGTTIQVNNGKEQEEKEKIANYISTHKICLMAKKEENNRSMLFKNIDIDKYISVIELIKNDTKNCKSVISDEDDETKHIVKFEGRWSDKVTITYTKSTNNVRIQGRPLMLFNEITSYFNELVDLDNVVDMLEDNFKQNISKNTIEEQYKAYLPYSYNKHSNKLKKSLLRSVYNLNVNSQEYTCTELCFEVLRALEGHIKLTLFNDYNIESPNKYGTLQMFKFKEETDSAILKEPTRSKISDMEKIEYYEKSYKHIVIYRHKIFHWDYPDISGIDETIQLENVDDAKIIIKDTLSVIDEYYRV